MPRRSPGDGSLEYIEAKEHYLARITVGLTAKGNPNRLSKTFSLRNHGGKKDARRAAEDWLSDRRREKETGKLTAQADLTLREFGERYTERKKAEWKPKHYHTYTYNLKRFAYPAFGDLPVSRITPLMVQTWCDGLLKQTTPYMAYRALFYLRLLLNQAVDLELIVRNPARKVKLPMPRPKRLTRWTPAEVRKVLKWLRAQTHPLLPYVHIALTTGLRREELFGLTWARLSLEERYLDVREVVVYVNGRWSFDLRPKTAKAARRVYFDPGTARMFKAQRLRVEALRLEAKGRWQEMDLVFPSPEGFPLNESRFLKAWKEICEGARVTRIRPYDTRSTWSTLSVGKLPEHVAVARAGHSESVRQQHYIRSVEEEQRAAALTLEELLGG